MNENAVMAIVVICFMGWLPILAISQGIAWIVKAWRINEDN